MSEEEILGWSNFVIIPSLNIAIEISRHLNDLEDYEKRAFNYLTSEEFDEEIDYEIKSEVWHGIAGL
jgi:hypothetical protein